MSENSVFDSAEALVHKYVETNDPSLRDEIVLRYHGLVERIARKYSGLEPIEDLVQVGYMGLLNALNMFEPAKGVRFNTYATHLVAGSIKHHLRDRTKIIREPAWLQEIRHKVNRTNSQLQQELGRPATEAEIAERAGVTEDLVAEVFATEDLFKVSSLTVAGASEEEDGEEIDFADEGQEHTSVEERFVLEKAIGELRDLEQSVLSLFHFESLNQSEIASRLQISPNYVSHILRQSLSKLRGILNAEERNDRNLRRETSNLSQDIMDEVTDSYSEEYMLSRLDEECARASCSGGAVAFIRIQFDGLETLRRFYGSETVDRFLRDAVGFLKAGIRRLDIVGRLGETGFGIVLPGAGEQVEFVSARLQRHLSQWLSEDSVSRAGVIVLFGSAFYPESGRSGKRLLQAAKLSRLEAWPEAA